MSKSEKDSKAAVAADQDDEPDEWYDMKNVGLEAPDPNNNGFYRDKRIFSTGCAVENTRLNDCYYEKKDWRLCKGELEKFRKCWKQQENDKRTGMKDV